MLREAWKGGPACQGHCGGQRQVQLRARSESVFTGAARTAPSESYIIPQRQGDFLRVTGGEAETKGGHVTRTI